MGGAIRATRGRLGNIITHVFHAADARFDRRPLRPRSLFSRGDLQTVSCEIRSLENDGGLAKRTAQAPLFQDQRSSRPQPQFGPRNHGDKSHRPQQRLRTPRRHICLFWPTLSRSGAFQTRPESRNWRYPHRAGRHETHPAILKQCWNAILLGHRRFGCAS